MLLFSPPSTECPHFLLVPSYQFSLTCISITSFPPPTGSLSPASHLSTSNQFPLTYISPLHLQSVPSQMHLTSPPSISSLLHASHLSTFNQFPFTCISPPLHLQTVASLISPHGHRDILSSLTCTGLRQFPSLVLCLPQFPHVHRASISYPSFIVPPSPPPLAYGESRVSLPNPRLGCLLLIISIVILCLAKVLPTLLNYFTSKILTDLAIRIIVVLLGMG